MQLWYLIFPSSSSPCGACQSLIFLFFIPQVCVVYAYVFINTPEGEACRVSRMCLPSSSTRLRMCVSERWTRTRTGGWNESIYFEVYRREKVRRVSASVSNKDACAYEYIVISFWLRRTIVDIKKQFSHWWMRCAWTRLNKSWAYVMF